MSLQRSIGCWEYHKQTKDGLGRLGRGVQYFEVLVPQNVKEVKRFSICGGDIMSKNLEDGIWWKVCKSRFLEKEISVTEHMRIILQ